MTKRKLKKILNAGGATLDKNGKPANFKTGFQVSKKDCFIITLENIEAIYKASQALLDEINAGEFLGLWVDSGRVYIDISEYIENRREALRIGRERAQISIFDWSAGACVYC